MKLKLHDRVYHPKYSGCTVQSIIDIDPEYIRVLLKTQEFRLSRESYKYYREKLKMLKYNLGIQDTTVLLDKLSYK